MRIDGQQIGTNASLVRVGHKHQQGATKPTEIAASLNVITLKLVQSVWRGKIPKQGKISKQNLLPKKLSAPFITHCTL
jgi:hypothetical protein